MTFKLSGFTASDTESLEADPDWRTGSVEVIVFGGDWSPTLRIEHKGGAEAFIECDIDMGEDK